MSKREPTPEELATADGRRFAQLTLKVDRALAAGNLDPSLARAYAKAVLARSAAHWGEHRLARVIVVACDGATALAEATLRYAE